MPPEKYMVKTMKNMMTRCPLRRRMDSGNATRIVITIASTV